MEKYRDAIIYGLFFITSLVFPLWASTFAIRRGRQGWSKIAIISIVFGLGFFGGLGALTAASIKPGVIEKEGFDISSDASIKGNKKKKAAAKGACPKCNSNLVKRTVMVIDPVTQERTKSMNQERQGTTSGTVMIVFGLAVMGYTLFRFFTLNYSISYLAACGIGGYFVYLGLRPWLARSQENGKKIVESFICSRCEHEWDGPELKN